MALFVFWGLFIFVGDISAVSNGERVSLNVPALHLNQSTVNNCWLSFSPQVFCIFLFLSAASLFGTIIAQVNEIVGQLTTKKKDLDHILASYVYLNPRSSHRQIHQNTSTFKLSLIQHTTVSLLHPTTHEGVHIVDGECRTSTSAVWWKWPLFCYTLPFLLSLCGRWNGLHIQCHHDT